MSALLQVWRMTCYEWFDAVRSRRVLVALVLYMAVAACTMYWAISILGQLEDVLVKVLQLPQSEQTGIVSTTLWKSKHFQNMMQSMAQSNEVYQDLYGKHPVELIYAWLLFFYMPMLVVLVAANRIPEEVGSGSVRYVMFRSTRGAWVLGKFFGQLSLIGLAVLCSGVCAYLVALIRLGRYVPPDILYNMLAWAVRAWVYAVPFTGLVMGLSLFTKSPGKSTIVGMLAIMSCFIVTVLVAHFTTYTGWRFCLPYLAALLPADYEMLLWRKTFIPLATGTATLVSQGFFFLAAGYFFFRKRDC
ncbi:MAG: ABC transporter permease [Kiritimatiellaeota bacterium]|nr:ABC transporter permease [Kiritimatiellota bacterium]